MCFHHERDEMAPTEEIRPEEVLIDALARMIGSARHVGVGANSPIPAAAAFLAQELSEGKPTVSLQESPRYNVFTDGGHELFDAAGQGRIDVFFLSGAQIDGHGNINLVALGDYAQPKRRFAGSYGSSYLYFVVPRVILFRTEHSRRTLVERVDFVSAPGTSPPHVYRPGGPAALVTPRCVFVFDRARARFRLESVHPQHRLEEVIENTGFEFDWSEPVQTTPSPSAEVLKTLRGPIAAKISQLYPSFAAGGFGATAQRTR